MESNENAPEENKRIIAMITAIVRAAHTNRLCAVACTDTNTGKEVTAIAIVTEHSEARTGVAVLAVVIEPDELRRFVPIGADVMGRTTVDNNGVIGVFRDH